VETHGGNPHLRSGKMAGGVDRRSSLILDRKKRMSSFLQLGGKGVTTKNRGGR